MLIRTWKDTPAYTVNKVLRNHIEVSVDIFHDALANGDIENAKRVLSDIMQDASTYGYHLERSGLRQIISTYLDQQTDELFADDNDWSDIVPSLEYLIRMQMLMGALED